MRKRSPNEEIDLTWNRREGKWTADDCEMEVLGSDLLEILNLTEVKVRMSGCLSISLYLQGDISGRVMTVRATQVTG
jgi:hypothetical protein